MFALLINASILILAAASFHKTGKTDVTDLGEAHTLLSPLLGARSRRRLFAIALLCCGLNSTVTATLAGQAVMEGFINIRMPPWLRRLITRAIAIIPAAGSPSSMARTATGEAPDPVAGRAEPAALRSRSSRSCMFTASRAKMGDLVAPRWLTAVAAVIAAIIVALNLKLLFDFATG